LLRWQPHGDDGVDDYFLFGSDPGTGRILGGAEGQQHADAADLHLLQGLALAIDNGNVDGGIASVQSLFAGATPAEANSMEVWAHPQTTIGASASTSSSGCRSGVTAAEAQANCSRETAADVVADLGKLLAGEMTSTRIIDMQQAAGGRGESSALDVDLDLDLDLDGGNGVGVSFFGRIEAGGIGGGSGGEVGIWNAGDHVVPERATAGGACTICGLAGGELFCPSCCSAYFGGGSAPPAAKPVCMVSIDAVVAVPEQHSYSSYRREGSPVPALVPDSPVGADAVFTDDDDTMSTGAGADPLVDLDAFWTSECSAGGKEARGGVLGGLHDLIGMPSPSKHLVSPTKMPGLAAAAHPVHMQMPVHTLPPLHLHGAACSCGGGMFCSCNHLAC